MTYLLDANTFIEAKGRYYAMAICPGYWSWLIDTNGKSQIASIESVRQELLAGNDVLKEWVAENPQIFVPEDDPDTQAAMVKVVTYVYSLPNMRSGAAEEFLDGADPWLIAKAIASGNTIVTHEKYNKEIRKKVLIPNVCEHFNVSCIDTFELLHRLEAEFVIAA